MPFLFAQAVYWSSFCDRIWIWISQRPFQWFKHICISLTSFVLIIGVKLLKKQSICHCISFHIRSLADNIRSLAEGIWGNMYCEFYISNIFQRGIILVIRSDVNCIRHYIGCQEACIGWGRRPNPNTACCKPNIISYPPLEDIANIKLTMHICPYPLCQRPDIICQRPDMKRCTVANWLFF